MEALKKGTQTHRENLLRELKLAAPRETGELARSFRRGSGDTLVESTSPYGGVLNARGKHKGWRDRAERRALRASTRKSQ